MVRRMFLMRLLTLEEHVVQWVGLMPGSTPLYLFDLILRCHNEALT